MTMVGIPLPCCTNEVRLFDESLDIGEVREMVVGSLPFGVVV